MSAGAPAAMADTPSEAVVPAAPRTIPRGDTVVFAGPGGFLHQREGDSGYVWTSYASGADTPLQISPSWNLQNPGEVGAGSDVVTTSGSTGLVLNDMDSGSTTTIRPPAGQRYIGTFGSRLLTEVPATTGTAAVLHVLSSAGGQLTDTAVTGWPAGATPVAGAMAGDATSVVVSYTDAAGTHLALLDLATGTVTPAFSGTVPATASVLLSDSYIAWYSTTDLLHVHLVPRSAPTAAETVVDVPAAPSGESVAALGIAGSRLLTAYGASPTDAFGGPLTAMPLSGGTPVTLLAHVAPATLRNGPGGALAVGGTSSTDWAARRITVASDGTPAVASVAADPAVPAPIDGLSLAGGQLYTIERNPVGMGWTRTVQLGSGAPAYGAHTADANPGVASNCDTAAGCVPPIGTGDGRISQLWRNANSDGDLVTIQQGDTSYIVTPQASNGTLVDSDGNYVVYDNAATGKQYIGSPSAPNNYHVLFTRPLTAAGLSGSTLWAADGTGGEISAIDLTTRQTMQTVETGNSCTPTEVQAAADRWIYWSCGTTGPAGVVDAATGAQMAVPAGIAQIGNGFVVTHDTAAGTLVLTDVHADTAVTSDLASLPADTAVPDDRRVTWAVDKYNGGIAYTDAQENIHLVDPHIPASAAVPAQNTSLLPGERLVAGDSLTSGSMRLVMQSDGNLVAYVKAAGNSAPEWSSGTWGNPGAYAVMQPDGNLVVYRAGGGPTTGGALWSSGTWGHPGAYALVQDDGNIVVYQPGTTAPSGALWSTGTYAKPQTIAPGTVLHPGWWTQAKHAVLVMQPDGNLVLYRKDNGSAIWSSGTWGHSGAYAEMQKDGNLVVYRAGGGPSTGGALWSSGTWGHSGAYALVQDDDNFVVYGPGGGPSSGGSLWASNTWSNYP